MLSEDFRWERYYFTTMTLWDWKFFAFITDAYGKIIHVSCKRDRNFWFYNELFIFDMITCDTVVKGGGIYINVRLVILWIRVGGDIYINVRFKCYNNYKPFQIVKRWRGHERHGGQQWMGWASLLMSLIPKQMTTYEKSSQGKAGKKERIKSPENCIYT